MIFLRLEISYILTFNDGKEHDELFIAFFPEALANELLEGKVRKQMELAVDKLLGIGE